MQGHQKNSEKIEMHSNNILNTGCENKVNTLKREQRGPMIDADIFNVIQKVQDTVIHLEVDEEHWKITQGSKRQAKWV